MSKEINWLDEPEEHDYPAAFSYLSLIYNEYVSEKHVKKIRESKVVYFKAKDIFRASGLSLLGISNYHVEKNIHKIKEGKKLSPLLLLRDPDNGRVIVADGYHRLCAVYTIDEDIEIPCKIG
jgi:hypothetical protein